MKNFMYLGLMAALSVGFAACDDDDENNNDNNYQLEVRVHMDSRGSDAEESESIHNTYLTAMGIDLNDSIEITTIAGKDSLDCVKTILERCAKAEELLKGKEWSDSTAISVRSNEYNSVLYKQSYGASADNAVRTLFYFDKCLFFGRSYIDGEFECATGFELWNKGRCIPPVWTDFYSVDLNKGAGGNYIYPKILHKDLGSYAAVKAMAQSTESVDCVTDAFILIGDKNPKDYLTYKGLKYQLVKDIDGDGGGWSDINKGAGGKYLYMYVTHEHTGKIMCAQKEQIKIYNSNGRNAEDEITYTFSWMKPDKSYYQRKLLPGVEYVNGVLTETHPLAIDLNMGAGGDYIYWLVTYFVGDKM